MESAKLKDATERAAELAWKYEQQYGGCGQVALAALKETVGRDKISDSVFQAATGMAGGVGRCGYACGALNGSVAALSCFWGRPYDDFADPEKRRARTLAMAKALVKKFEAEYGSADCRAVQTKIMGRSYDISVPEEMEQFVKDGGHDDKCPSVCANAVRWTIEILQKEGLV
jgi:C_GCAxxG_C_C family probable redox protein